MRYSLMPRFMVVGTIMGAGALPSMAQQQVKPSKEIKVGARNSAVRNIGTFQIDSALIFPRRRVEDTLKNHSKALRKKGAFFWDSATHVVWFFDGKRFQPLQGNNIYTADDSIHEKDRIVTMNGRSITFQNNRDHGMVVLKNKGHDNLLKIEADNQKHKLGGLWLAGKKEYKQGFKLAYNPKAEQLEFYLGRYCAYNQDIVDRGRSKSLDSKVLFINEDGETVISGIKSDNSCKNTGIKAVSPTLKFQREKQDKYWFLRFDEQRNQLYLGKYEEKFESGRQKYTVRNRMSIDDNVVVIGPKKNDRYHNYDATLNVRPSVPHITFASFDVYSREGRRILQDIPSLFINGTIQGSALITGSDSALKREVQNLPAALPNLLKLRSVSYFYRDTSEGSGFSSRPQLGFIAQEVRKVFPNLVQHIWSNKVEPVLGINYIGLIAQVVTAVQELYQHEQSQKYQQAQLIEALSKARNIRHQLEQRVQSLEKLLLKRYNPHAKEGHSQAIVGKNMLHKAIVGKIVGSNLSRFKSM